MANLSLANYKSNIKSIAKQKKKQKTREHRYPKKLKYGFLFIALIFTSHDNFLKIIENLMNLVLLESYSRVECYKGKKLEQRVKKKK